MKTSALFLSAAVLGLLSAVPRPAAAQLRETDSGPAADPPVPAGAEAPLPSLDPAPHIARAVAAMRARQWKAARNSWEAVLKLEPDNAAALSNLGKVQYQMADHEAARLSLEKATALKPELTDSWLTLGLVYLELKAPMMAVSAMTRGVAENPADPRAHNSLAIVLKRIGWTNGAEAELQKALDLDPEYAEAHFNLAVMYLERKPPAAEMAGRHYRKARALGAAPDEIVEKQIRGESEITETDASSAEEGADDTGSSAAGGSAGETPQTESGSAAAPGSVRKDSPRASVPRTGSSKKTTPSASGRGTTRSARPSSSAPKKTSS